MPKAAGKRRSGGSAPQGSPYAAAAAKTPGSNNIFKFNTESYGQHVLKNPGIADAIVAKAGLRQSDTVLEVGPGTGNLTVRILEQAKRCVAVELDPRMAAEVTKRVQQSTPEARRRLDVVLGDVIKLADLPPFDVCISNTPYQISSPLTFKLLALQPAPRVCILMFQREFAMRLFAKPGDKLYSRLSVNAQMWAKIDHIMKVGKNNFRPPPQVESSVVRLVPKTPRPRINYDNWDGLLRVCFVRKNKTLRASFLGTTSVMEMLDSNYRTWCAQNDVPLDDGPVAAAAAAGEEGAEGDDVAMGDDGIAEDDMDLDLGPNDNDANDDDDDDLPDFFREERDRKAKRQTSGAKQSSRKKKGKVAELVRDKVVKVLEDLELADKRARMCDEGDFLKLLHAFNTQGIYFA